MWAKNKAFCERPVKRKKKKKTCGESAAAEVL